MSPGTCVLRCRPMNSWRNALLPVTAIVVVGTAIGHMFFIVPAYRRLLEGVGAVPSLPARVAIGLSHFGAAAVVLCVAAVGIGWWAGRRRSGLFSTVLTACALAAAVYLGLAAWVYLAVVQIMERVG